MNALDTLLSMGSQPVKRMAMVILTPLMIWMAFPAISSSQQIVVGDPATGMITQVPTSHPDSVKNLLTGLPSVFAVAADDTGRFVYWTDFVNPSVNVFDAKLSTVTVLADSASAGVTLPRGIALDAQNGRVYWSDNGTGTIRTCWTDKSHVKTVLSSLVSPGYLALDLLHGQLYCADNGIGAKKIIRCDTSGANVQDVVTGLSQVKGIALDVEHGLLYLIDAGTQKLQRAVISGTLPVPSPDVTTLSGAPRGLVVDGATHTIYWSTVGSHSLFAMSLDTLAPHLLDSAGMVAPTGLTLVHNATPAFLLTKLEAVRNGDTVTVRWNTSSEYRSFGFTVQRLDGIQWDSLAFEPGQGTSNTPHAYTYIDNRVPDKDTLMYRLKHTSFGGGISYSAMFDAIRSSPNGISADSKGTVPKEFALGQNYPNPFNPSTTIRVSVPQKSRVTIKVYDIKGSLVATWLDSELPAGYYSLRFDGSSMSSGIYFYRMTARLENGAQFSMKGNVKRFILLR